MKNQLLETAIYKAGGRYPLTVLVQTGVTLALWLLLTQLSPGLFGPMSFNITVLGFITCGLVLRRSASRRRSRKHGHPMANLVSLAIWLGAAALCLATDNPRWIQHMFTLIPVLFAVACLIDIWDGEGTFSAVTWPGEEMASYRPALTRVFLLKHAALALLNETLIALIDASTWLVFLALLPVFQHFVNSALTTTVLIDRESGN